MVQFPNPSQKNSTAHSKEAQAPSHGQVLRSWWHNKIGHRRWNPDKCIPLQIVAWAAGGIVSAVIWLYFLKALIPYK